MYLLELFDTFPKNTEWEKDKAYGRDAYITHFHVGNTEYKLELSDMGGFSKRPNNEYKGMWNVAFTDTHGSWETSGAQEYSAIKVFGAVFNLISDFAKKHDAQGFRFYGFNERGDVYISMVKFLAKKLTVLGYSYTYNKEEEPNGKIIGASVIIRKIGSNQLNK
jgi:hypothetical protein